MTQTQHGFMTLQQYREHMILSVHVQQRLDQQIEDFLAEWLPKLDQPQQFRLVFDGLMQMGHRTGLQSQALSQHMLQRNLAKLTRQNLSQQLYEQLHTLQGIYKEKQKASWLDKFKQKSPQQEINISDIKQGFYEVLINLDTQQTQLHKDNMFLQREVKHLFEVGQALTQYIYLTENLFQRLFDSDTVSTTSTQQEKQEILHYLQRKKQDLLQQQQLNIQSLQSMQQLMESNQILLNALDNVEQRIRPLLELSINMHKAKYQQQQLDEKANELKKAITVYQQWLDVKVHE